MAEKNNLNILSLGLSLGITWAAGIFFLGIMAWLLDWGTAIVEISSALYIGYKATPLGIMIGTVWAFVDGFIGGVIIAWLYNKL
ncbi:MAG: bacteriophage holin [Thermodesulfobacteriota bacterium]|nr:bacteriophage holin [Thermodesulfobacteriota bacterium]